MNPPRRRYRTKLLVAALLLVAAAAAVLLVRSVLSSFEHACEVCVTYRGRTICREAVGHSEEDAIRIAAERACEFLTAAPAERAECLDTPPDRQTCEVPTRASPGSP